MDAILGFIVAIVQLLVFGAIGLAIVAIWGYNSLRRLAEGVKEAQSNIEVALRKKISLVNQLIDVANKYSDRESMVMLKVSQDTTEAAMQQMYQQSGTVLSTINGLAQKFPELKASEQYTNLAAAIAKSEEQVQDFRVICNARIKEYNSKRSALPHALYASALGFRPARYLELEAIESSDASVQKGIFSDDGDRINELLGMAGTKVLGATKVAASQGRMIAEKAASRVQQELAARAAAAAAGAEYHYLDSARTPKGPVSRAELDNLFAAGQISAETDVLEVGKSTWIKFSELQQSEAAE